MKTPHYQKRHYRGWVTAEGLFRRNVVIEETDIQLSSDKKIETAFLRERITYYRRQIADYGVIEPRFLTALKPICLSVGAQPIVKAMSTASHIAGVGPMAAVAGAIAQFIGRDLLRKGCREVIIENGGDIFLATRRARTVRIFCGEKSAWRSLGIRVPARLSPLGVCTSSATIGHSLSFGRADAAVILARTATLADAVATAACNRIHRQEELPQVLAFTRSLRGVFGAVLILKRHLATWGAIELVS